MFTYSGAVTVLNILIYELYLTVHTTVNITPYKDAPMHKQSILV